MAGSQHGRLCVRAGGEQLRLTPWYNNTSSYSPAREVGSETGHHLLSCSRAFPGLEVDGEKRDLETSLESQGQNKELHILMR